MKVPPYGDDNKRIGAYFSNLQVKAQIIPDMTVYISSGGFWYYTSTSPIYVEYVGGSSPEISCPFANSKFVVITISEMGENCTYRWGFKCYTSITINSTW